MAFVYRYIDENRHAKYYGMVNGDDMRALNNRIYQHSRESSFDPTWEIEYIDGLTRTDADLLETHFINSDSEYLINKAKRTLGPISIGLSYFPRWIPYSDPRRTARAKTNLKEPYPRQLLTFAGRPLQPLPGGFASVFNKGLSTAEIHSRIIFALAAADKFRADLFDTTGELIPDEMIGGYASVVLFELALLDAESKEELSEDAEWEADYWNEQ